MVLKELAAIIFLHSALTNAAPNIQWAACPDPETADRCLEVQFASGERDIAELHQAYEDDNTNFEGFFMNAPSVRVFASKPDRELEPDNIHVSFVDPRSSGLTMLEVNTKTGIANTARLDGLDRLDGGFSDLEMLPSSGKKPTTQAHWVDPAGNTFGLRVIVFYDNYFRNNFTEPEEKIRSLFGHAATFFLVDTLDTKILLDLREMIYVDDVFRTNNADFERLPAEYLTEETKSTNLYLFMTYGYNFTIGEYSGLAELGTVCSPNIIERFSMVAWAFVDIFTSYTIAHEIGHNLGMKHDFIDALGHGNPRFCETDPTINCIANGTCHVMDYPACLPDAWSCCSNSDFALLYNQLGEDFCLPEVENCNNKKLAKCKKHKKKGQCKKKRVQRRCMKSCGLCP